MGNWICTGKNTWVGRLQVQIPDKMCLYNHLTAKFTLYQCYLYYLIYIYDRWTQKSNKNLTNVSIKSFWSSCNQITWYRFPMKMPLSLYTFFIDLRILKSLAKTQSTTFSGKSWNRCRVTRESDLPVVSVLLLKNPTKRKSFLFNSIKCQLTLFSQILKVFLTSSSGYFVSRDLNSPSLFFLLVNRWLQCSKLTL